MTGIVAESTLRTNAYTVRAPVTHASLQYTAAKQVPAFAVLTIEQAKELVGLPAEFRKDLLLNRRLYYGDHWLDGDGWKGPWPQPQIDSTPEERAYLNELWLEIMRGFTPRNGIAEVDERHTLGVVGNEPRWTWTADGIKVRTPRQLRRPTIGQLPPPRPKPPAPAPVDPANPNPTPPTPAPAPEPPTPPAETAEEKQAKALALRADQLNSQVTTWWDAQQCAELLQQYTTSMLYGRVVSFRLLIPASALEDEQATAADGTRSPTGRKLLTIRDVDDAFAKIHVEVFDADEGRVVRDRGTLRDIGVRLGKRGEQDIAHVTYLDDTGRTVMAVVDQSSGAGNGLRPAMFEAFDLGGRLLMHTSIRDPFNTEQVRQAQYAMNYANSVIPRNLTTSGFQDTILTNVHLDGETVTDPRTGRKKFIPDPVRRGPAIMNALQGHKVEDAQGAESFTPVGVHDRQPVDPKPTIDAKREHYRDMLEEVDQLHVLLSGDAVASGVSRMQARAQFVTSLKKTATKVERAGRWLIETATAFAYALADGGSSGTAALDGLRVTFQCILDAGPLEAADRAALVADVGAGLLSPETAIERGGIIDVDAELDRIEQSRAADLETKRATIFAAWITAGADETWAGYRAGLSPEEIERLMESFSPPQPVPAPGSGNPNDASNTGDGAAGGGGVGGAGAGGGA